MKTNTSGSSARMGGFPRTHGNSANSDPSVVAGNAQAPGVHSSRELIDRRVLFGNPARTLVRLSPNGKLLSWLAPKDGVLNVWVAPIADLSRAETLTAEPMRPVRHYVWSFDSEAVLFHQDKDGDENFHLFAVSLVDKQVRDLTPIDGITVVFLGRSHRQPNSVVVGINDRDPKHHDVWKLDLSTGHKQLLVENTDGFLMFEVDLDLAVRFGWKRTPEGAWAVFQRNAAEGIWVEYETIPLEDADTTYAAGFTADGTGRYVVDSRGRNTSALLLVDVATRGSTLLYENPKAEICNTLLHPTEKTLQAVSFEYDRETWVVIDPEIRFDFDEIVKLDQANVEIVSRTTDDTVWLIATLSDVRPGRYYLWDRKSARATFLFSARPDLDDKRLAPMRPVEIPSRDQLTLLSYLTIPTDVQINEHGVPTEPLPAVLWVHGGPTSRDRWGYHALNQFLANRGYAVLNVNFRGSTGFGKALLNGGDRQWGKKMHNDLLDAVQWLIDRGIARVDKVAIGGGSYGGYATLAGLSMTPDVFACGVDMFGPSNIVTLLEAMPPYWTPNISSVKHRVGDWTVPEGRQALLEVSPITHVARIKRPLLIGQGLNDPRVLPAESDRIVSAMQEAGIPVTYVQFPDEGHGFARPENSLAFFSVVEAFLAEHLGGRQQPISKEDLAGSTIEIKAGQEHIAAWPL